MPTETASPGAAGAQRIIVAITGASGAAYGVADVVHRDDDLASVLSSGSFRTEGMLVASRSGAAAAGHRAVRERRGRVQIDTNTGAPPS